MGVQCIETNADRMQLPRRCEYDEKWTVTTRVQPESAVLVFDLALGPNVSRWFTYWLGLDDQA